MPIDRIIHDERKIDGEMGHQDDRRKLISAYNGEFKAELIETVQSNRGGHIFYGGTPSSHLFFMLEGSAVIRIGGDQYALKAKETSWDRLIMPPHLNYELDLNQESIIVDAIDVVYPGYVSREGQFTNQALFYHRRVGFQAVQLKFIMPFEKEALLGGHYHDYGEAYSMVRGDCRFRFEDIETHERREQSMQAILYPHLVIPAQKAHTAKVGAHSILVGCTQDSFSREKDSAKPYSNEWLKFKE